MRCLTLISSPQRAVSFIFAKLYDYHAFVAGINYSAYLCPDRKFTIDKFASTMQNIDDRPKASTLQTNKIKIGNN